jgi:hypothetical protein
MNGVPVFPKRPQTTRHQRILLGLQESAQPLAFGRTILEILLGIDIDPEFVHEKLGEGAVAEVEDIPAAHGENIVQQSHVYGSDFRHASGSVLFC